jgi:hypothetical protein
MTRENWLRLAIEKLNSNLFNGDLDLLNNPYQVSVGVTSTNIFNRGRTYTVFFPYDGEDPTLDDFFPVTMIVDHAIKDPVEMLEALSLACIRAFFNHKKDNKKFKKHAEDYYFEQVDKQLVASDYLKSILNGVYGVMVRNYGDYPGKAVVQHVKEKTDKERQKNTIKMFCPNCDFETKTSRKVFEKYGQKCPVCVCGTQMAVDLEDENNESESLEM